MRTRSVPTQATRHMRRFALRTLAALGLSVVAVLPLSAQATVPAPAAEKVVQIVMTAEQGLPTTSALLVKMSGDRNRIYVNEAIAKPYNVAMAIEHILQIRHRFGDKLPGDIQFISAPTTGNLNPKFPESQKYTRYLRAVATARSIAIYNETPKRHTIVYERATPKGKPWSEDKIDKIKKKE